MSDNEHTSTPTRRTVLKGLGSVASAASLAGCGSALPGSGGESSVRYAQVLAPTSLDPVAIDDVWSAQAARRVFDGLYAFGAGTGVVPSLASGPPTREPAQGGEGAGGEGSGGEGSGGGSTGDGDGTPGEPAYTVEIRADATFQNGEPVTAEDVAYSFEAPVEEETPPKWALDPIETIRTPDERTVTFELAHPYPAFEYALTRPIVPKAVRESDPDAFATSPVGSGPYEADVVKPGTYTALTADDDHWRGTAPEVSTVKFVGNHSGLARSMSLRTGQNEVVERVEPKLWSVTEEMPNTRVQLSESLHYFYVGFNCRAGPTADPNVRKAIDHLIDMDDLVQHFVAPSDEGEPPVNGVESGEGDASPWRQYGPLPERLAREWEFPVERWREIPRRKDPERARTLLQEAGVSSWQPTIAVPPDMLCEKVAEAIVHELSKLGFRTARTKKYSWSKYREALATGSPSTYNMFVGSWSGWPDPDSFLYPLFHENAESLTNFTFYKNEGVMNRLLAARETRARPERKRLYEDAIATLLEDRVHLPAFTLHNTFGVAGGVDGFEPHPVASVNPRLLGPDGDASLSV